MKGSRFERAIRPITGNGLMSLGIETLQVNLGLRCNQRCRHCHVGAGPDRTECMPWATMEQVLAAAAAANCSQLDLTGGAPELNPNFRRLIDAACAIGLTVQVRTNLTVHTEPGMEDLAEFLRDRNVALVGSLPCYLAVNVDAQRGRHAHQRSIEVIRRLNELGYGADPALPLNLVYNPVGPTLPPAQSALEADYHRELAKQHGVYFTKLLTITNMPIGRFLAELERSHQDEQYMETLTDAFNGATIDSLMCRRQVSVGWDGKLYDCDFNLALGTPIDHGAPNRLEEFDAAAVSQRRITTGDHCFGCTAGFGSSCGGALVSDRQ